MDENRIFSRSSTFSGNVTEAVSKEVPKYVFYFIGDGLGASQRQIASSICISQ
ncbi:hypothetical protein [Marinisporobacter balticus]|uniref:Uncharacterized protein n=1 Tax=Marinisporobacter balticus TaxID=2018667 RepID=A0A4R2KZU5_9FIRM|nr:hypothetical protein [Marinisporobacter balticus]TCO72255.1 hypothetical protein EV214_1185 [Marinisporobacter balticus]